MYICLYIHIYIISYVFIKCCFFLNSPCRAFRDRYQTDINVRCVLSCDSDTSCQQHITQMGEAEVLFSDVAEVANGSGINIISGQKVTTPEADVLVSGTSCVNLSSMNLRLVCKSCFLGPQSRLQDAQTVEQDREKGDSEPKTLTETRFRQLWKIKPSLPIL